MKMNEFGPPGGVDSLAPLLDLPMLVVIKTFVQEKEVTLLKCKHTTGWAQLIRSHLLAWFCFELSRNLN